MALPLKFNMSITPTLSKAEQSLLDARTKQSHEAQKRGWSRLYDNTQTSPDMGKWLGHRSRLFGIPPQGGQAELVPDFFNEVQSALDAVYPL